MPIGGRVCAAPLNVSRGRFTGRTDDRLEGHPAGIGAKFLAQSLCNGIDDGIKIARPACQDLIDDWRAGDEPSREKLCVGDLLLPPDDGDGDVREPRVD